LYEGSTQTHPEPQLTGNQSIPNRARIEFSVVGNRSQYSQYAMWTFEIERKPMINHRVGPPNPNSGFRETIIGRHLASGYRMVPSWLEMTGDPSGNSRANKDSLLRLSEFL
jgi:hypothetical protein